MTRVHVRPNRKRHRHPWDDFDRTFQSLLTVPFPNNSDNSNESRSWSPSIELTERESGFVLTAEIPGLSEKDIDIVLKENVLTISGEKKAGDGESNSGRVNYSERKFGEFKRTVRFNTEIDPETITADYQNGVLTIFLPKPEKTMEKEIPVNFSK